MSSTLLRCASCIVLLSLIAACDYGGDCGPFADRWRTVDFVAETYHVVLPADSLAREPELRPIGSDTLAYDAFGISMTTVKETYFSSAVGAPSAGFVSAAYACSPAEPSSDEIVRSIQIHSDAEFRSGYPAGANLAGLFDVLVVDHAVDHARNVYYERHRLSEYLGRTPHAADEILLVLNTSPDSISEHVFTVSYAQEGSGLEFYEIVTDAVTLRPGLTVAAPHLRSR